MLCILTRVLFASTRRLLLVRRVPLLPPQLRGLGPHQERKRAYVNDRGSNDHLLVLTVIGLDNASGDGDAERASVLARRMAG